MDTAAYSLLVFPGYLIKTAQKVLSGAQISVHRRLIIGMAARKNKHEW